jgi:tetratricopeptide (TPR) repeat protein
VFDVHDAIQPLPGSTKARQLLVATGLKYLDSLALEAEGDPELEWELAQAYIRLGNVQGAPRDGPHLGDTAGALASHAKALALLERLAGRDPDDMKARRALVGSYRSFGDLQVHAGREPEAQAAFDRAIEAAHAVVGSPQRDVADFRIRALTYLRVGERQRARGEIAEAVDTFQKALEDFRRYAKATGPGTAQSGVAQGLLRLAGAYGSRGDVERAVQTYREVVSLREQLAASNPKNVSQRRELAVAYTYLAEQLFSPMEFSAGNRTESLLVFRKALAINEELAALDPNNAQAQRDLILGLLKVARSLEPDAPETALQLTQRAERIARGRSLADPQGGDTQRIWIYSLYELASRLQALRRTPEALEIATKSLHLMEEVAKKDPGARGEVVDDHLFIGDLHVQLHDSGTARGHYDEALKLAQAIHAGAPRDLYALRQVADAHERIGHLHARLATGEQGDVSSGDPCREARIWFQKTVDVWNVWGEKGGAASYRQARQREILARMPLCEPHGSARKS